jgi:DNA-binding transcriptional regulator GbsR (MarR family)
LDEEQRRFEIKRLIEEMGLLFEMEGLPRMAGQIIGQLLFSRSPLVSSAELAEALQVTKGVISTTSRLLIQIELIERVKLMGDRRDYFRLKKRPWFHSFKQELYVISAYRQMAQQGLVAIADYKSERKEALEEMFELYSFLEKEFPALIARWEQEWANKPSKKPQDK